MSRSRGSPHQRDMGDSVPPAELRLRPRPIARELRVTPGLLAAMERFVGDVRPVVGAQAGVATWTAALWELLLERYEHAPRRMLLDAHVLPPRPSRRWGTGRVNVESRWGAWALRLDSGHGVRGPRAHCPGDSLEPCRRIRVRLAAPLSRSVDRWIGDIAKESLAQCEFSLLSRGMWRQLLSMAPAELDALRAAVSPQHRGRAVPLQCLRFLLPCVHEAMTIAASEPVEPVRGLPARPTVRAIRAGLPLAMRTRRLPAAPRPEPSRPR